GFLGICLIDYLPIVKNILDVRAFLRRLAKSFEHGSLSKFINTCSQAKLIAVSLGDEVEHGFEETARQPAKSLAIRDLVRTAIAEFASVSLRTGDASIEINS